MHVSTVTTVSIQMIFCSHVTKRRSEVFSIPIMFSTCSFSVVHAASKSDVYQFFSVSTGCSSQLQDFFFFHTHRYWPFRLWYKWVCLPNFSPTFCVKPKWLFSPEKLFQSTTQSTLLTFKLLIKLPICIFWHTLRTQPPMDTFKSPLCNGLFKYYFQNFAIEKESNISHKTPAVGKLWI